MRKNDVFIVIPEPLSGLFPRLMPEMRMPIRARKVLQRKGPFYLVTVYDPEEQKDKIIVVREPECWEAEVTVQVRRKE